MRTGGGWFTTNCSIVNWDKNSKTTSSFSSIVTTKKKTKWQKKQEKREKEKGKKKRIMQGQILTNRTNELKEKKSQAEK